MSTLESILGLLEKWPTWKRMREAPDRVDALEEQVRELKKRLERAPGKACPKCGVLDFRVVKALPSLGIAGKAGRQDQTLECGECGYVESRHNITPG